MTEEISILCRMVWHSASEQKATRGWTCGEWTTDSASRSPDNSLQCSLFNQRIPDQDRDQRSKKLKRWCTFEQKALFIITYQMCGIMYVVRPCAKIKCVASGPSLPSCVIPGHRVEAISRFTYLGSDVDSSGYCTPEIHPLCPGWIMSGGRISWVTLLSFASTIRVSCYHCYML